MHKNKKGQISTIDLVIAASIFISLLLSITWAWNDSRLKINLFENKRELYQKGLDIAEMLVKTSGDPANWHELNTVNSGTVNAIGLASEDNVLDEDKLDKLGYVDYEELRRILGLSKEDFNLTVYNITGGAETPLYSFGRPSLDLTKIRISRYASFGINDIVELRLLLFYNTSKTHLVT
jgi:hypothetical protein